MIGGMKALSLAVQSYLLGHGLQWDGRWCWREGEGHLAYVALRLDRGVLVCWHVGLARRYWPLSMGLDGLVEWLEEGLRKWSRGTVV